MKLERINENKIKCTLTRSELAAMHINLTELAYGTEKAKELFKDLMYKAKEELGFEADETPIMIEAIPVKPDSLMLIITKVDNPEEMNSRFSKFAGDKMMDAPDMDDLPFKGPVEDEEAEEMNDMPDEDWEELPDDAAADSTIYQTFAFDNLNDVIEVAHIVTGFYDSNNSLYSNPKDKRFYLIMYRNRNTKEEFRRAGIKAGEYGREISTVYTSVDYFEEHFRLIVKDEALQRLAQMK